jgi:hypothetical protein
MARAFTHHPPLALQDAIDAFGSLRAAIAGYKFSSRECLGDRRVASRF